MVLILRHTEEATEHVCARCNRPAYFVADPLAYCFHHGLQLHAQYPGTVLCVLDDLEVEVASVLQTETVA